MAEAEPVLGVGAGNFRVRSGAFVREPGSLQFVDLIAEQRKDVHNAYLQALAETGIPGLVLFVAVAGLALGCAATAERRLAARGDPALAAVAHGLLLALVGMLTALIFISYGHDSRLWLLFGLGPALLAISARRPWRDRPRA
jgi:O-antigen ligase